jgi:mannan endo-1,4-beta-mannosidase
MAFIKVHRLLCLFFFLVILLPASGVAQKNWQPTDAAATKRTRALFQNLHAMEGRRILFGHQDDLAYGVYWKGEQQRSDVQETCGAYPAVFGWDLGQKFDENRHYNIDSVKYEDMRRMVRQAYKMGSVNTFSWHVDNLTTGGNSWDTTTSVRYILPGGKDHAKFLVQLDGLANFLKSLKAGGLVKHHIPVILRPWHEHTGSWFWWGTTHCTPDEYKQLWRFTIDYLRNTKQVHNVLFAYSPDFFKDEAEYMRNYPGDEYVDILGLDYYYRTGNLDNIITDLPVKLALVAKMAAQHQKLAAFTETGFESIPKENWWTDMLLNQLKAATAEASIAYVLLWRNAYKTKPNHYYVPYPGQISAHDFIEFSRDGQIVFQNKLPNLYKKPKT